MPRLCLAPGCCRRTPSGNLGLGSSLRSFCVGKSRSDGKVAPSAAVVLVSQAVSRALLLWRRGSPVYARIVSCAPAGPPSYSSRREPDCVTASGTCPAAGTRKPNDGGASIGASSARGTSSLPPPIPPDDRDGEPDAPAAVLPAQDLPRPVWGLSQEPGSRLLQRLCASIPSPSVCLPACLTLSPTEHGRKPPCLMKRVFPQRQPRRQLSFENSIKHMRTCRQSRDTRRLSACSE